MNIAKNMEIIFVAAVFSFCTLSYVADNNADTTQISTTNSSSSSTSSTSSPQN